MARTNASLPAPMQLHTTTSAPWMICRAAAACAASRTAYALRDADWGECPLVDDFPLAAADPVPLDGVDVASASAACDTSFTHPFAAKKKNAGFAFYEYSDGDGGRERR